MKITKKEFFSQHDLANPCLHQYLRKIDADLAEKVRLGGCLYCLLGVLPAHHGITTERMAALRRALGIDRRTLERWRQWWLESFVQEPYWKLARAAFMPPLCQETLPLSLARAFAVGCGLAGPIDSLAQIPVSHHHRFHSFGALLLRELFFPQRMPRAPAGDRA